MSTIDATYEDINKSKSSTSLFLKFSEILKQASLTPDEDISDSQVGFFNNLLAILAKDSRISLYEQKMYLNETNINTAVLYQTLLRYLNSDELSGIYGYPAESTFILGFSKEQIVKQSVTQTNGTSILRINKDAKFIIEGKPEFILDHDIIITCTSKDIDKANIYATYDTSDSYPDSPSITNNILIDSHNYDYYDDVKKTSTVFVLFYIRARQMARNITIKQISNTDLLDFSTAYSNNLYAFELLYKPADSDIWTKLNGFPKGSNTLSGYEYSLVTIQNQNKVRIEFSQLENGFIPQTGSQLKLIIYTTEGTAGNIEYQRNESLLNQLTFVQTHDTNDITQSQISSMSKILWISGSEGSVGGRNQLTFLELKDYIINMSNSDTISTTGGFENECKKLNFDPELIIKNFNLSYRVKTSLENSLGRIPTGTSRFLFNLKDILYDESVRSYMISPNKYFIYDQSNEEFVYNPTNNLTFRDYCDIYNNNGSTYAHFPYFLKLIFSENISSKVYDMSVNENKVTQYKYFNSRSLDKLSVSNVYINRNPLIDAPTVEDEQNDLRGYYSVSFTVSTSFNTITKFKETMSDQNPYLKFKIMLKSANNSSEYVFIDRYNENFFITNIDDENNKISFAYIFMTNNTTNDNNKLCITNKSISSVPVSDNPFSFYFIDYDIEVNIIGFFIDSENYDSRSLDYDKYLNSSEKLSKYVSSIQYSTSVTSFCKELTEDFNIPIFQRFGEQDYLKYNEDQYQVYLDTIYEVDENGEYVEHQVTQTLPNGETITTTQPVILHNKGDFILDDNGEKIILYHTGDFILDSSGSVIKSGTPDVFGVLPNTPWIDRLFVSGSSYSDLMTILNSKLDTFRNFQNRLLDGMSVVLAFKKTLGFSNKYYAINEKTDMEEVLTNTAISLGMGIKLKPKVSGYTADEKQFIKDNIINNIILYVESFNTEFFSFDELFDDIKRNNSSIKYITILKFNQYLNGECQSIRNDLTVNGESLSVKIIVDSENSDFSNETYVYKPDIDIEFI